MYYDFREDIKIRIIKTNNDFIFDFDVPLDYIPENRKKFIKELEDINTWIENHKTDIRAKYNVEDLKTGECKDIDAVDLLSMITGESRETIMDEIYNDNEDFDEDENELQLDLNEIEEVLKEDIPEQTKTVYRGLRLPRFWKCIHKIPHTKNGKFRDPEDIKEDRRKFNARIDESLKCPMNYLLDALDTIPPMKIRKEECIPISDCLVPVTGRVDSRQERKVLEFGERLTKAHWKYYCNKKQDYSYASTSDINLIAYNNLVDETNEILNDMKKSIRNMNLATMQQIIRLALGECEHMGIPVEFRKAFKRNGKKILTLLYKYDEEKFMSCFM